MAPGVRPDRPRDGGIVATLALVCLAIAAVAAVLLLSGLPARFALILVLLGPSVAALLLGAVLARRAPEPERSGSAPVAPQVSAARAAALDRVTRLEMALREAEPASAEVSQPLLVIAMDLHEARLELARVVLKETGDLPADLKAELLVAHRNFSSLTVRLP